MLSHLLFYIFVYLYHYFPIPFSVCCLPARAICFIIYCPIGLCVTSFILLYFVYLYHYFSSALFPSFTWSSFCPSSFILLHFVYHYLYYRIKYITLAGRQQREEETRKIMININKMKKNEGINKEPYRAYNR